MSHPKAASATPFCFFLISVAYKLAWTTISSLLSDYSKEFGPEILLWLNFAYFIPSIPVLVIQSYFNDIVDKICGAPQANLIRFTVGLGGLSLMCAVFPFVSGTAASLLLSTCIVGVLYGVAFGTSYQMVARFPPDNSVALTTGFVSSGLVVLLFDLLLKSGPYYTAAGILWLYRFTAVQTVVGLIAAVWVILKHWQLLDVSSDSKSTDASLDHRTGGGVGRSRPAPDTPNAASHLVFRHRAADEHQAGAMHPPVHNGSAAMSLHVDDDHDLAEGGRLDTTQPERASSKTGGVKPKVPLSAVFMRIWPAAAALFLSVGTSMLVFPFFTYMRSTGLLGDRLPQGRKLSANLGFNRKKQP